MATQIKTWQIVDGKLEEIDTKLSDFGRTESYDLESWIASNPSTAGIPGTNLTTASLVLESKVWRSHPTTPATRPSSLVRLVGEYINPPMPEMAGIQPSRALPIST